MSNVNVQIAVDDGAALQALSSIHRVDHGRRARFVTGPVAGTAKHSVHSKREEGGGGGWLKSKFLLYLHHPEIICPLPNSFQTIQANKSNAWHRAISHAESLNSVPSELMRLTRLISETKHRWYVKKKTQQQRAGNREFGSRQDKTEESLFPRRTKESSRELSRCKIYVRFFLTVSWIPNNKIKNRSVERHVKRRVR